MIYVMSDINGDFDSYQQALQAVNFNKDDDLYILGNVIDIGPDSLEILQDMMMRDNVYPLLGEHEYWMLSALKCLPKKINEETLAALPADKMNIIREWFKIGGQSTLHEYAELNAKDRQYLQEYMGEFEAYDMVETAKGKFILVHSGIQHFDPDKDLDEYPVTDLVLGEPDYKRVYYRNAFVVNGHTPTRALYARDQGLSLSELSPDQYKDSVYVKNHHININCGNAISGRLAILCLDTMKVKYIDGAKK